MKNQSLTILGLVVILIGYLFQVSGVDVAPDKIQTAIEVIWQGIGILISWYGRYRQGDIKWFGLKK